MLQNMTKMWLNKIMQAQRLDFVYCECRLIKPAVHLLHY